MRAAEWASSPFLWRGNSKRRKKSSFDLPETVISSKQVTNTTKYKTPSEIKNAF
jgi:hypothetical protein